MPEAMIAVGGGVICLVSIAVVILRRIPKRPKRTKFTRKWRELQGLCSDKQTWTEAIVAADRLLDEALKKRRKRGHSMGERLVAAQRDFTDNDSVWKAHKLAGQLRQSAEEPILKEEDVKDALVAFRQALRDLGAL